MGEEGGREGNQSARGKPPTDVLSGVSERDVSPGLLSRVNTTYTPVIATPGCSSTETEIYLAIHLFPPACTLSEKCI